MYVYIRPSLPRRPPALIPGPAQEGIGRDVVSFNIIAMENTIRWRARLTYIIQICIYVGRPSLPRMPPAPSPAPG